LLGRKYFGSGDSGLDKRAALRFASGELLHTKERKLLKDAFSAACATALSEGHPKVEDFVLVGKMKNQCATA
jgi:hypothetical protein